MKRKWFSFVWIIIGCGFMALFFIIGNFIFLGLHRHPADPRRYVVSGDPDLGRRAIKEYGCGGCHLIPGIANATGRVGPQLIGIGRQVYIAGVLANTPENMVRWIQDPQRISPRTAMPDLNVTDEDARNMAAYFYSL